jgi:hypothetical protein
MPVELTNLADLSTTDVEQNITLLKSYLEVEYPSMDLQPGGVLYSLLLRPAALFHTLNQSNMTRLRQANSLLAINQDPTLADESLVDAVLSNYSITRNQGGYAIGRINLIFSTNDFVAVPSSKIFTANGVEFLPVNPVYGVSAISTNTYSVLFTAQSDGTYVLPVTVKAATTGTSGNLAKGTRLTEVETGLLNLIDIVVASDFDGGEDTESNAELMSKISNGITTPSLGSRNAIKALIQNNFSSVTDISVVGAGDIEMLRDGHSTLGIKTLGKVDLYVRTRAKPITVTITKAATLTNPGTKTFSMAFTRNEYPGLYSIESILPAGSTLTGTLEVTSTTRGIDSSLVDGTDFVPAMADDEGTFTRYQSLTVIFNDNYTDTSGMTTGDTADFNVTLTYMPDIDLVNDWLQHRSRRAPGGDYLVKAPIPCFVGVGLKITVGPGDEEPDTELIKAAVIDAVNSTTFADGQLDSSVIINAAQSLLSRRSRVDTPIDLRGRVIKPDGNTYWVFDPYKLVIPTIADEMVSSRTVAFFLDTSNIIVETVPSDALPV